MFKYLSKSRKVISRRLRNLEKEGLVKNTDKKWIRSMEGKKLVCGVDEAGNE
ncbi:MAG: hypothetical protein Q8Q42_04050 [Nanoarchaeota archaeon]|nr:hypothetical protein [Nanoarchaeota archaeon]